MSGSSTNNKNVVLLPPSGPKPVGRSVASRAYLKALIDSLFNAEAEQLVETAIALARQGDSVLLKWAIDRISPPTRGSPIEIPDMPTIRTVDDALKALGSLCDAVAQGRASVEEAQGMAALLRQYIGAADIADLARRLEAVEQRIEEARGLNHHRDPEW